MRKERTTNMSLEEAILRKDEDRTDWERLRREAADGVRPDRDPDEGDFDWSEVEVIVPPGKTLVSVRFDDDVLHFFRSQGSGYQTRMNAVLRSYMDAHRSAVG